MVICEKGNGRLESDSKLSEIRKWADMHESNTSSHMHPQGSGPAHPGQSPRPITRAHRGAVQLAPSPGLGRMELVDWREHRSKVLQPDAMIGWKGCVPVRAAGGAGGRNWRLLRGMWWPGHRPGVGCGRPCVGCRRTAFTVLFVDVSMLGTHGRSGHRTGRDGSCAQCWGAGGAGREAGRMQGIGKEQTRCSPRRRGGGGRRV